MAKKKLQPLKVESVNAGVNAAQVANTEKGSVQNPYTIAELETMLEAGTWQGGYVESVGAMNKAENTQLRMSIEDLYNSYENQGYVERFIEIPEEEISSGNYKYKCSAKLLVVLNDAANKIIAGTAEYYLVGMSNEVFDPESDCFVRYATQNGMVTAGGHVMSFQQVIVCSCEEILAPPSIVPSNKRAQATAQMTIGYSIHPDDYGFNISHHFHVDVIEYNY